MSPPSRLAPAPPQNEHRAAPVSCPRTDTAPRLFVKQAKGGNVSLRLVDQDDQIALPAYGLAASVRGTVEMNKTDGITSVQVQVEGILRLEEVAEGGTSTRRLFLNNSMLWIKDRVQDALCPNSLRFNFPLPATYSDGDQTYPLPPSFEARLSGFPGFWARVRYRVSAMVIKPTDVSNMVKSTILRKDDWTISTPFLYLPRTRPSVPIPVPLVATTSRDGFDATPQWKLFSSIIAANRVELREVVAKLYIPSTRTFCVRQSIPFHLSLHSDINSLRAFAPLAPMAGLVAPKRQATRIQLMRQTTVDVRNAIVFGTKADIWRVDCIGEGVFRNAVARDNCTAVSGDIFISDEVTVGGFRASGFSVRDYLVLTVTPPELSKSPYKELRMVVPIRLATDRWNYAAGSGACGPPSISSSEELATVPELPYAL